MLDKLLGSKPATPDPQSHESTEQLKMHMHFEEQKQHFLTNIHSKLEEILNHHKETFQTKDVTQNMQVIDQSGFEYDPQGYKYTALWVSVADAGAMIVADFAGVQVQQVLHAGLNQLDFLIGTRIMSPNKVITPIFIRSDFPLSYKVNSNDHAVAYYAGSGNQNITLPQYCYGITVTNDSASNVLQLTINGMTFKLNAGEVFDDKFYAFNSVNIQATDSWRVVGRA